VNLTGARTPTERVTLLVAAVLPALPLVRPGLLLDVGSGNGSPGLVLALADADRRAVLLEPRAKRWAFLREAVRAAGAGARVEVVRSRHDAYAGAPATTVTLRALALPLPALAPLVAPDGRLLVFGARPAEDGPFRREEGSDTIPDLHVFRRCARSST
jgi:16S rRNA (guanine527-N7)-methyltransferase